VILGERVYFDLGTVNGERVWLARTEMGSAGPSGSHLIAAEAIASLAPSATVMVGIAFGVDDENHALGDILVPTDVVLYDHQRVGQTATAFRGLNPSADPILLGRLRAAETSWPGAKIRFGTMLSGSDLVDNQAYRDWLRAEASGGRAIGGEMELTGVFAAAERYKSRWIAAKAICDWGAAKDSGNKSALQKQAAKNEFVFHALTRGLLASAT
jgi:nucleoside phosphorylase